MKKGQILALTLIACSLLFLAGGVGLTWAQGARLGATVGTAFTYQGQLTDNDEPADGDYDFEFKLHDDPTLDSQVGSTIYVDDKEVTDGLFTVLLDFGSGVFTGEARYLEIGVRPGDSTGAYTTLAPRQELTPAPYAQYALDSLSTESLQGHPVSDTVPSTGQLLQWDGSAWIPATMASTIQPPVAVLQADRGVLMPGETTTLSLTLSYDPEGGPLTYAFDPTGETLGAPASYGSADTTTVTSAGYEAGGDYLAAGWVKDASGAFDVARVLISVWQFWTTTVDSAGNVGQYASMAVVDGRPAIAYFDDTNNDLKYVRATTPTASAWPTPLAADSAGSVGQYTSLAVVDGYPAIAYYDPPNGDLKYVRASDARGFSWGTPVTVDSTDDVGRYVSLAVVDGNPAIAYHHVTNRDLKYVRASDATGSSWPTPLTVDSAGDVGRYASLAVVENRPAIAYRAASPDYDLKYVRASDATGSSWPTPLAADSTGDVGHYPSLAVVDGRPAIAYFDATNSELKYVRASDATGSSWGMPVAADSAGDVGRYASLAVVDGYPAIAYYDAGPNYDLKYVRASDAAGSSWGTGSIVDSAGIVGEYASLAVVDGRPGIAYYDDTNDVLRFAVLRHD
jgi:hypothetical protein